MNDLEVCKKIAELEGVEIKAAATHFIYWVDGEYSKYNPITDLSLLARAMFKYQVNIEHCTQFDCGPDGSGSYDIPYVCASIKDPKGAHAVTPLNDCSDEAIARAVCECILKSQGLWNE
jgi:hypothetical protein